MPSVIEMTTYQDLVDHLIDYQRDNTRGDAQRDARRAVQSAWRTLPNAHRWSYYDRSGRFVTNAPYTTGTIEFDLTGGSSERLLTLSDGTWPSWSSLGVIVIGDNTYGVARRLDSTTLQLEQDKAPSADVAASTSYTLYRDTYPTPPDLRAVDDMCTTNSWRRTNFIHSREWNIAHRYNPTSSNTPQFYTIFGSPEYMGSMAFGLYPYPDSAINMDFMYKGGARNLINEQISDGTIVTASSSLTVTGTDTVFNADHIGAVLRVSANTNEIPTGRFGANPFDQERVIVAVDSTTSCTVDQEFDISLSAVKYTISDPLDIEPNAMLTAFLRCCEKEIAIQRRFDDRKECIQLYNEALADAKEADSRILSPRSVYTEGLWSRRLAYMPTGDDEE